MCFFVMKFILYLYNHLFDIIPGKSILIQVKSVSILVWAGQPRGGGSIRDRCNVNASRTGSGAHPVQRVPGPLSLWVKPTRIMVTTHLYLVQSLRINRALSALPYMPSYVHRDNFISVCY